MENILKKLESPFTVQVLVLALVASYWLIRWAAFSGLSGDEAEQVLFAQSFQWGYDVANPPLYTWILIALFALFGKSAGLVIGLKYCVLAGLYIALYWAARITLRHEQRLDCALVALSPVLIFFVSWQSIFSFSHSLLNALLVILTYVAFVKLMQGRRLGWALALGVAMGLGVMTKYSYLLFLIGIMVAGLSLRQTRELIISKQMLVSVAVSCVIAAPHLLWLLGASQQFVEVINYKLQIDEDVSYLSGVIKGLWNLLRAAFAFMSPLWLVVALVFPVFLKPAEQGNARATTSALLGRTFLVIILVMVAMVLVGGISQFRPNYLFLMVLFPLWVFTRIPAVATPDNRRRVYGALLLAGGLVSVGGLGVKAVTNPTNCTKCQLLMPYEDMARAFQDLGFTSGTLFATWYPNPLPGNLALYLDDARTISSKFPSVQPPQTHAPDQCLMVWIAKQSGGPIITNWSGYANKALGTNIQVYTPWKELRFPIYRQSERHIDLRYIFFDQGVGQCR